MPEEEERGPAGPAPEAAGTPEEEGGAAGAEPSPEELRRRVEALLFSSAEPLSVRSMAAAVGAPGRRVRRALGELAREYEEAGRAFELVETAGGFQLLTRPRYAGVVARRKDEKPQRLSAAALEVLAVVAYEQPVTRLEIESIRGVASGPVIRTLIERGLLRVVGRSEEVGNPLLYGTTERFLEVFGLRSLKELPRPEEAGD